MPSLAVQNALAVFGAWFVVLWYFVVLVPGLSSSGLSFGAWFVVLWFVGTHHKRKKPH
jgi:hypothetical protein